MTNSKIISGETFLKMSIKIYIFLNAVYFHLNMDILFKYVSYLKDSYINQKPFFISLSINK